MNENTAAGLTQAEAARKLQEEGPNELPVTHGRSLIHIVSDTMRVPMLMLLVAAAVLYIVHGNLGEGIFLVFGASASIGLVILQEARSERALTALRELAQPHVRVIRDGTEQRIASRELVP